MSSKSRTATPAIFFCRRGKALRATDENKGRFDKDRAQLEARNLELKKEAEAVAAKLTGQEFVTIRQAGDTGQLYGSVSPRDIAEVVTEGGFSVDRRQIVLDRPIKTLGLQPCRSRCTRRLSSGSASTSPVPRPKLSGSRAARTSRWCSEEALEIETFDPDAVFEERGAWRPKARRCARNPARPELSCAGRQALLAQPSGCVPILQILRARHALASGYAFRYIIYGIVSATGGVAEP